MKVSSTYLREEIAKLWPDLNMVILVDSDFILPKVSQIEKIFKESKLREMQFIPQFNDCDNFSLHLLSEIRKKHYDMLLNKEISSEEALPWSVSIAICSETRGISAMHAVNLAICEEGVYIFDITPESDRFWKSDPKMDNPIVLFM